jgi:hypothetical protein
MYPRVATAYDQNPARIQFVVIRKKESSKPIMEAIIGIYLLFGLAAACFWNYLPI